MWINKLISFGRVTAEVQKEGRDSEYELQRMYVQDTGNLTLHVFGIDLCT